MIKQNKMSFLLILLLFNISYSTYGKTTNYRFFKKKPYFALSAGVGQSRIKYQGSTRAGTAIVVNGSLGYWLTPLIGLEVGYWNFPSITGITDKKKETVSVDNNHLVALSVNLASPVEDKISAFFKIGPALGWPKIKCSGANCPVIINGESWGAGTHRQVTILAELGLNYSTSRKTKIGIGVDYAHDFGPLPSFYAITSSFEYTY